jgi:hypothetical protein
VVSGPSGRKATTPFTAVDPSVPAGAAPGKRSQDQEGQGHTCGSNNHLVRNTMQIKLITSRVLK